MQFLGYVQKVYMQGGVSQIIYLCPSLNVIQCRKCVIKKLNLPVFCHKMRTRA